MSTGSLVDSISNNEVLDFWSKDHYQMRRFQAEFRQRYRNKQHKRSHQCGKPEDVIPVVLNNMLLWEYDRHFGPKTFQ
ncbi:MAG: hypothetical protein R3C56_09185 [Pirellulaceae bacterium]